MKGDFTRWTFKREKHYHGVLKQQGRVDLDADWNEQRAIAAHRVETEAADVIGPSGAPVGNAGFAIAPAGNGASLNIGKGRAYVSGLLCENEQDVLITAQPDLPSFKLPTAPGIYIAYLSVWLRHVTALDDDQMREDALGGPDTCTRARTVWQVNLVSAGALGTSIGCASVVPAWDALVAASTGTLAARAEPDPTGAGPCTIPAKAGYRRLENQLYRVEVHAPSTGTPTFKWSRDNGSVVTSWKGANGNDLTVSSTGRDGVLGFAAGQWVELTDDSHELNFRPGTLVQLATVQGLTLTISPATATGSVNFADFPLNPKIRRWDSPGPVALSTGNWLPLEDGVQVEFSSGTFATGDYWLIPARTLRASVEWPLDGSGNPVPAPPAGIARRYCRLAIVQFNGTAWSVVSPCLPTFPPLTQITSGDDKGIHVTDVALVKPAAKLPNDSDVLVTDLLQAGDLSISVHCDAPIDPVSVQSTTCIVTVELPYPFDVFLDNADLRDKWPILGYQPLVLPGKVSASGNEIVWSLSQRETLLFLANFVLNSLVTRQGTSRLLVRLTLKGNFIWGLNDATTFLDGNAFGIARKDADGTTHIGMRLPQSGDGKRGGDFEMWFWLMLPVKIASVGFAPNVVNAGQSSTATVTLTGAAPAGGAVVTLSSVALNAAGGQLPGVSVANVPASVTVPAGQTSASFAVSQTSVPGNAATATLRMTAAYAGSSLVQDLTINRPVTVTGLSFSPSSVLGGATGFSTGTVTLSGQAPANGATVTLANNNAGVATVPQSVIVAAGKTSQTFSVTTAALPTNAAAVSVQVTASFGGATAPAILTVIAQRLG